MAETLINKNQQGDGVWTTDTLKAGNNISFSKAVTYDYTVVGNVTIGTDKAASGFSTTNYINVPDYLSKASTISSFEYVTAVSRTSTTSDGGIYTLGDSPGFKLTSSYNNKARLRVSFDGSSYSIDISTSQYISSNTKTWIKITYSSTDGYTVSTSTDGTTWTQGATSSSTARPYQLSSSNVSYLGLNGTAPFGGSIYLNDTYLNINGERVWDCLDHSARDEYYVNCDLDEYLQNTATGTRSLTLLGSSSSSTDSCNIGTDSTSGIRAVSLGNNAQATTESAIAIGYYARANATASIAIGAGSSSYQKTSATAAYSIAIGSRATASGEGSLVISPAWGNNAATASGAMGISIGTSTSASAEKSIAIGANAKVTSSSATQAIQLGAGTNSTANTFQVFSTTLLDANGKIPMASTDITSLAGYDAAKTQVLKNVNGTLTWVDEA